QVGPMVRYEGKNPVPPNPRSAARLRVLMANVLHDNHDHDALAALIRKEQPDVVGLVEFSHEWVKGLERAGVRREFAYRVEIPSGASGLALYFRRPPLSVASPEVLTPGGNPALRATIELA